MSVFILEENLFRNEKKKVRKGKRKRKTRSTIRMIWGKKKGQFLRKRDKVRTRSVSCCLDLSCEETRRAPAVWCLDREGGWVLGDGEGHRNGC